MCVFTVVSPIFSSAAISALDSPRARVPQHVQLTARQRVEAGRTRGRVVS
ncbi:hypothetical protein SALBM135S_08670 [Streptomyces alboniger]